MSRLIFSALTLVFDSGSSHCRRWEFVCFASSLSESSTEQQVPPNRELCSRTYLMKPLIIIIMIYVFIAQQLYKARKMDASVRSLQLSLQLSHPSQL